MLKQGRGLEQAFPTWKEDLCKHVYHLKDLREAIKELQEPDFAEIVIKESSTTNADSDTTLDRFVTAVGGTTASLSGKQRENYLIEEATRLRNLALARKSKYEENKRILTGTLFHGPYISNDIRVKLKNEMGVLQDPTSIPRGTAVPNKIPDAVNNTENATYSTSYYDVCVENGDLITLLTALEKSCRHLDGSIDALELKSKFYAWEPKKDSTLQQAFDDYERLNTDLIHCKVFISEEERVAKLILNLQKLTDLTPLLIDIRDKIERNIGPASVAELMATVTQYVKHLNLIFRKIDEPSTSKIASQQFIGNQQFANISKAKEEKVTQPIASNYLKKPSSCNKCGKRGHIAKDCRSTQKFAGDKKDHEPNDKNQLNKIDSRPKGSNDTTNIFPNLRGKGKSGSHQQKTSRSVNVAKTEDIFEQFAFAISVRDDRKTPRRIADTRRDNRIIRNPPANNRRNVTAIYDTGASIHIVGTTSLLIDVRALNRAVSIGTASGDEILATSGGIWRGIGPAVYYPGNMNIISHSLLVANGGSVSFDSTADIFTVYPGRTNASVRFTLSRRRLYECPLEHIAALPPLPATTIPAEHNIFLTETIIGGNPATPIHHPGITVEEIIDLTNDNSGANTTATDYVIDLSNITSSSSENIISGLDFHDDEVEDMPDLTIDEDKEQAQHTFGDAEPSYHNIFRRNQDDDDADPSLGHGYFRLLNHIDPVNTDSLLMDDHDTSDSRDNHAAFVESDQFHLALSSALSNGRITRALHAKLLEAKKLHDALGHPSAKRFKQTLASGKILDCSITAKDIDLMYEILGECTSCLAGKTTNPAAPTSESPKAEEVGEVLHVDIAFTHGNGSAKAPNLIIVDEKSKYLTSILLDSKSQSEIQTALTTTVNFYEQHHHKPKRIVCDRESVFLAVGRDFKIPLFANATDAHSRTAERYIRHLKNMMRTELASLPFTLPHFLHPKLLENCAHLHNLIASTHLAGAQMSPCELVIGFKPKLDQVMDAKFGTIGMFVVPNLLTNDDMAPRAHMGMIVGFEPERIENKKVYMIGNPRNSIVIRRKFKAIPITQDIIDMLNLKSTPDRFPLLSTGIQELEGHDLDDEDTLAASSFMAYGSEFPNAITDDGNLTIQQAFQKFDHNMVRDAIFKELNNMQEHQVWEFILNPKNYRRESKRLPSRAFMKAKFDANGRFTKCKLRLVAGGHRQREDSYGRTSSPTIDISSVFTLLSLVKLLNAKVATVDIPAAYLHADLHENIIMTLPKDLSSFICSIDNTFESMLDDKGQLHVLLKKSLYGLKQAGANWYDLLVDIFLQLGYKRCAIDACVFFKSEPKMAIVGIHVDDLLCLFQCDTMFQNFKAALAHHFGSLDFQNKNISFLGMNIHIFPSKDIFVSQPGYATKICATANITNSAATPSTATLFSDEDEKLDTYVQNSSTFKSLLMSAMFLATRTRPDIYKECVHLARYSLHPGPIAFHKLRRIYQYIFGTINHGIKLGTTTTQLAIYTDASYAVHNNGRSHSGIIATFAGYTGPLFVKSHAQKLVTLSSTEAELVAIVEGVRRILTIQSFLQELNLQSHDPIIAFQDNKSTIHIIHNGEGYSGKNRHMRVRFGFISELLKQNRIAIEHLPTDIMIADLLTKPIGGHKFRRLRDLLLNK